MKDEMKVIEYLEHDRLQEAGYKLHSCFWIP